MNESLREIRMPGVHPVVPTEQEFNDTIVILRDEDLEGEALENARKNVQAHLDGLFMIEVQIVPAEVDFDACRLAQAVEGLPESDWQVPCDEVFVDSDSGHWAFSLHFVNLDHPLSSSFGDLSLPLPTPMPPYPQSIEYLVP